MFKNYFKIAWRNLIKLSTGLACALLIWLWLNDEMNMINIMTTTSSFNEAK